ncbi:DltD domain-containing protein [Paenibacillus helianthi]|uniref:DltD domain-containing protein n=1 Tax=Paenibacillus helianthi TaxID=1349432 RepID=A0ABX3EMA1_9BACL|nr:DinB family protein [Paenibacillus helianthi]OKP86018.1 DltD domain-containing protein [Paenibacillus helianthi]
MVQAKEVLSNQLLANANDPSWYVTFTESVQGLSEDEALWKADEDSNSIAELVQHLLYWNQTWQTRYLEASVHAVPSVESNNLTFQLPQSTSFEQLQARLLEVLLNWRRLLTEAQLAEDVLEFPGSQWWEIVGNVTTHNAYHIGQIVFIRKLQKSWKRSRE